MSRRTPLPALAVGIAVALGGSTAHACPNCREAVAAQGDDGARLSQAFNTSILFMLAVPLSILGTGAFAVARAVKKGTLPPL